MKKRMVLHNKIYSEISRGYGRNFIVNHYYDKDEPVPIWAIFELLTLGEFGNILACLNQNVRVAISKSVGFNIMADADGRLPEQFVYALKDLRNAVAHNNTVFDTRFKTGRVSNRMKTYISTETSIENISFDTIADYVILISYLTKRLGHNTVEIKAFINQFAKAYEELRNNVPTGIFSKIIYTDTRRKWAALRAYL